MRQVVKQRRPLLGAGAGPTLRGVAGKGLLPSFQKQLACNGLQHTCWQINQSFLLNDLGDVLVAASCVF